MTKATLHHKDGVSDDKRVEPAGRGSLSRSGSATAIPIWAAATGAIALRSVAPGGGGGSCGGETADDCCADCRREPSAQLHQVPPSAGPSLATPSVATRSDDHIELGPPLLVGRADDAAEREADSVAESIMHFTTSPPALSDRARSPSPGLDTRPGPVRLAGGRRAASGFAAPPVVKNVLASPGQPLSVSARNFFEPRFGHSLAHVMVHTGPLADESTRAIGADAFTSGSAVVFANGRYSPSTPEGRRLLAHELVHTMQGLPHVARSGKGDAASAGSTVGYVAVYLGDETDPSAHIDFNTSKGMFRYELEDFGTLKPGEYQSAVAVKGTNVDFTLDVNSAELFGFSYRVKPGQPNPSTFFANQSVVTFTVTQQAAPVITKSEPETEEETDPHTTYLTLEEALRRCELGDLPGVKVFPYRGTRAGAAPLTVFRDGDDIVVKSYVYVLGNQDFSKQARSLPTETFIGGVRLKKNEIVRVHTYEPRWYHLNITGSTAGDIEEEFCVTGEGMLKIGEMSDSAVKGNIALTVFEAATFFVPVGRLAAFVGKPVMRVASRWTSNVAAAVMLSLREVAPTAFGGIASRQATVLIEEQVVDQVVGRAVSQTASHAIIEFGEKELATVATQAATKGAEGLGTGIAADAVAQVVKVTLVDAAGSKIVSTLTTPTGDAALDKTIDEAFGKTFNTAAGSQAAATAGQGVVAVAPEVAAGFTQVQVTAFRRLLGKRFDSNDIKILQTLWDAAARPGDAAILNAGNSEYLFKLHRKRFWARVAGNPQAAALFTDAGCQFSGGSPFYMLNGRRIVLTIDHAIERQVNPTLALTASNLRLAFSRENSVVLRLLNHYGINW